MKTTIPILIGALLLFQSLLAGSTIQFQTRLFTGAETAGQVVLPVVRTNDLETEVAVEFYSVQATATEGHDFTAVSGTLSFAAGMTNQTINVPILNDALVESLERFQVILTNATGEAVLGSMKVATVSIEDNDAPVEFTAAGYSVSEAEGVVEVSVFRGDDGDSPVTVDYATADGTAIAGVDYEASSGTLTFETGNITKFVTVPILNDTLMDGIKAFSVQLSNLQGTSVLGSETNATVSIVDNETPVRLELKDVGVRSRHLTIADAPQQGCRGMVESTPPEKELSGTMLPLA